MIDTSALYGNLLFHGLPETAVDDLTRPLERVELAAGETLFHEGDPGTALYLVLSGMIQVYTTRGSEDVTIKTFLPGTYFGELALLGQEVRSASARALDPTTLMAIDGPALLRMTGEYPQVAANIGKVLAEQLVATTQTMVHIEQGELVLVAVSGLARLRHVMPYLAEAVGVIGEARTVAVGPRWLFPGSPHIAAAVRANARPERDGDISVPAFFSYRGGSLLEAQALGDAVRVMADYCRRWWRRTLIVIGEEERAWFDLALPVVDRIFVIGTPDEIARWRPDGPPGGNGRTPPRATIEAVPLLGPGSSRKRAVLTLRAAGYATPLIWLPDPSILDAHAARGFERAQLIDLTSLHQRGLLRLARALARSRVGIALGAGGARGMAHIGALRYLEELGVPIDAIAGTSMGSMVGGAFAKGSNSHWAEDYMRHWMQTGHKKLMRPAFSLRSILSGKVIENTCRDLFDDLEFDDLMTPMAIVAADLVTGRGISLREGRIASAVQASMSIPGLFPPVILGPYVLVDGGVCDPVPSGSLAAIGADKSIVVNISFSPEDVGQWAVEEGGAAPIRSVREGKPPNLIDAYLAAFGMAVSERAASTSIQSDVYIRPRFLVTSWREFSQGPEHLRRGHAAAERVHDQIVTTLPWLAKVGDA